ncbi:unnamed protein product [Parnassius apollo]|uniref:(apollo) hypothetical protein n=1 Tax=Parnassius apollo TaxID=110799 RepID=A0A8S3Y122_PARAO|nr:unnamed protein product [Parnassius apollo]
MTDSEDDLLSNNAFSVQNEGTMIHARGPNNTNYTMRNIMLPRNFERQKYGNFDQRSSYYKRETSPMSLLSVPDLRARNYYHNSYNYRGASYQRSIYHGRSGTPTSVRSIDTNASLSATDIALALKNAKFNQNDMRIIKDAYKKCCIARSRKRIEKRYNRRLGLKSTRRKTDDDSGEQGSDSSISSDDCRSIRTTSYKENIPYYKTFNTHRTDIRRIINESNTYRDCTDNIRQNYFRNMFPVGTTASHNENQEKAQNTSLEKSYFIKDRFQKKIVLPSQRFHKSANGVIFPEASNSENTDQYKEGYNYDKKQVMEQKRGSVSNKNQEIESEEITATERINSCNKRNLDVDDSQGSANKKCKVSKSNVPNESVKNVHNGVEINFVFPKPKMPVKRGGNAKTKYSSPEKLIAKSSQPLTGSVERSTDKLSIANNQLILSSNKPPKDSVNLEKVSANTESIHINQLNEDISMRPSFIKRKLFTQKLDVAENKNISDTSQTSSPQMKTNGYKERTKTRKLATSQSCLSRDVLVDDNNLLDLIHKIVPADQMNVTNATNRTGGVNRNSQVDPDDKWDVTSVISNCNDDDVSDTFTDEDIFKVKKKSESKPKNNLQLPTPLTSNCKVVLEKPPQNSKSIPSSKQSSVANTTKGVNKANFCFKLFWDTDYESDLEKCESHRNLNNCKSNITVNKGINRKCSASVTPKVTAIVNNKSQKDLKNSCVHAKLNKTPKRKKNVDPPDSPQNTPNSNLSNRSLRSNKSTKNANESSLKTVTLIGHRLGKPKRLVKKKCMNIIESPSPKEKDVSSSELNISIKSLRSWHKNDKINETLVAKSTRTRIRSGLKRI